MDSLEGMKSNSSSAHLKEQSYSDEIYSERVHRRTPHANHAYWKEEYEIDRKIKDERIIFRKRRIRISSGVSPSKRKSLGNVEVDLVTTTEDGTGLSFNASILATRRLTFNNVSRRVSSLIKRMSSSILPTSGITISTPSA
ncbi:hypothetical protein Tco_1109618 [Tanacetum coccineum]